MSNNQPAITGMSKPNGIALMEYRPMTRANELRAENVAAQRRDHRQYRGDAQADARHHRSQHGVSRAPEQRWPEQGLREAHEAERASAAQSVRQQPEQNAARHPRRSHDREQHRCALQAVTGARRKRYEVRAQGHAGSGDDATAVRDGPEGGLAHRVRRLALAACSTG